MAMLLSYEIHVFTLVSSRYICAGLVWYDDRFLGDILKLRAVHHEKLSHLVDCVVFASVAKPGHKAAPSMSSGGDLDGEL